MQIILNIDTKGFRRLKELYKRAVRIEEESGEEPLPFERFCEITFSMNATEHIIKNAEALVYFAKMRARSKQLKRSDFNESCTQEG